MSKKSKPPPAPDYSALAQQQAGLNQAAAEKQTDANRVNQVGPSGSQTWGVGPDGRPVLTTSYSPEYQQLMDAQRNNQQQLVDTSSGMLSQIKDSMGQPLDFGGLTQVQDWQNQQIPGQGLSAYGNLDPSALRGYGDLSNQNLSAFGSMDPSKLGAYGSLSNEGLGNWGGVDFGKLQGTPDAGFGAVEQVQQAMMGRLGSGLEQSRNQEIARLKAQGITEGSPAWQSAMQSLGQQSNDANQQALLGAMGAYGDIFNRGLAGRQQGVSEQMQAAAFANALRGQQFGEQQSMANFANQTRGQQVGEQQTFADYANRMRGQQFGEEQSMADFADRQRQQQFNEQFNSAQYANALRGQQFGEQSSIFGMQNQAQDAARMAQTQDYNRELQQMMMQRQLPLQEYQQLMAASGGAPSLDFNNNFFMQQNGGAANMYGAAGDQYKAQMDAYNAQQASKGGLMGGIGTIGGAIIGGIYGGPMGASVGAKAGGALGGMFG